MFNRPLTVDDLARLKHERDVADRAYNDALTALDGAVQRPREMPHPPPSYDEHQITPLNEHWDLLQARPSSQPGWRGRVRSCIWQTVAPLFEQQQAFNSALVDHINRNVAMHREFTSALASTIGVLREELERLIRFENRLLLYAQQVTPYVDTKERDITSLIVEVASRVGAVEEREAVRKQEVQDLRDSFGVVHQVTQMLKRELGRLPEVGLAATSNVDGSVSQHPPSTGEVLNQALNSYKYVGFENHFRGSTDVIRERLAAYLPHFEWCHQRLGCRVRSRRVSRSPWRARCGRPGDRH